MSLLNTMGLSTNAMRAQAIRLNAIASNIANADISSKTEDGAYKAKHALFAEAPASGGGSSVNVVSLVASTAPAKAKYDPADPQANEQGMVWKPNVDLAGEMSDMIAASRAYQLNAEIANVTRALVNRALAIGQ